MRQKEIRVIFGYVAFCLVNSIVSYLFSFLAKPEFQRLYFSFFTIFEYACFSFFIWLSVKNKSVKTGIMIISLVLCVFFVFYGIFAKFRKIDSIPIAVESIFILIFSFYFLYEQLNNPENLFIYNDYHFWMVIAFMFYLSGSFFIYIFADQIPHSLLSRFYMFTFLFYALKNILFSVGLLIFGLLPQRGNKLIFKSHTDHI